MAIEAALVELDLEFIEKASNDYIMENISINSTIENIYRVANSLVYISNIPITRLDSKELSSVSTKKLKNLFKYILSKFLCRKPAR